MHNFSDEEMSKFTLALSKVMSEQVLAVQGYMEIDNQVQAGEITPLEALSAMRTHFLPYVLKAGERMFNDDTAQLIGLTYDAVKQEMKLPNLFG